VVEPDPRGALAVSQPDARDASRARGWLAVRQRSLAAAADRIDTPGLLRGGVLLLALLGAGGVSIELVFLRHWSSASQAIVWPAMMALGVALVLLAGRPRRGRILVARVLACGVLAVAAVGLVLHVEENLGAGPLDRDIGPRWERMHVVEQWTAAIIGDVGPAPTLAPGALAEISLALLLATVRHPGTRRADPPRTG
jgi:hypothetical protein